MTSRSAQRRDESLVRKAQEPSKPRWLVPAVVIGVVAIAAIIAIALAGRGDSGPAADTSGLQQIQPVDVSGTKLPTFDESNPNDPAIGMTIPTRDGEVVRRHSGHDPAHGLAADAHVRRALVPSLPARGAPRQ